MDKKAAPLSGANNKRLESTVPTNSGMNAALTDVAHVNKASQTTQPSLDAVTEAKDWVDNGSRL
ncbi:MAG: DUF3787 domain-containing protein [Cellulosilyticaceae bacterium]